LHFALPPSLGVAVLLSVCVGALLKGGWEERITALGLLANVAFTVILRDRSWPHLQWAGFEADILFFALILAIALRSRKYWPLAAAAFALLDVVTHVAKLIDANVAQWAYFTAIVIWTYALFVALGVGTWNTWRAQRYPASARPEAPAAVRRR
jgi:hypothetical protein